uniref:Tetratricopeptide SHNi-TPR domain-containing protein n=1 Tax=Populus trichocarpa TaxID=3694 RepID=A0A3N7EQB4_POPTR
MPTLIKLLDTSRRLVMPGTVSQEDYANQMEAAQKELKIAWSILENESNCLIEKANTLCALGEVALRRGEPNPERYFIQASSFFESLEGEIHKQRIVHINVKICICLEGSDKIKAIEYGEKALSSYQTQLKRLISETQSSSKSVEAQTSSDSESSSATQIDPSIQKKKNERSMLIKILSKLQFKLDDLKAGSSTSPNLEGTSVAPAGHRDGKEKLSQLIQVLRIDKQFDN